MSAQTLETLEERMTALETKVDQLQREKEQSKEQDKEVPWWEKIRGQFKDDPMYEEAMRLGREWRNSEDAQDEGEEKC